MTLNERINADYIKAFKAKETVKKNFLSVIKGEIQNKAPNPTDENVLAILKSTKKSLEKSIELGDEQSKIELTFIEDYFPKLMSEAKIKENIQQIIVETGENNMGKIMGEFNKRFNGQADNKLVSQILKQELS